ncbi:MAG: hypothetical protein D8M57_08420 [Candidatus Scalindua sp. AMX11]|nr:MAG: hypothetical protein D8M57_08420 [Candidatus Scalindua sp. AMX11]
MYMMFNNTIFFPDEILFHPFLPFLKSTKLPLRGRYTKTDLVFGFNGNQILVKVSPDKRRRGLYSLNFVSDFVRKPL